MKYFAMIGGRQIGPMEIDDMVKEGVRPDTYVWCKQMEDWMPAGDVPDICRYFRQRLAGVLPSMTTDVSGGQSDMSAALEAEQEELLNQLPPMARGIVRKSGIRLTKENFPEHDRTHVPKLLPVILYILCVIVILIGFLINF
ncbi:MAG: DUF4339 domain-containing protein [Muribaculaceae bacterium]|nr:DUF4339 domain-containing protein [Muribaculaceae bacterium]